MQERDAAYWERRRATITRLYREENLRIVDLAARYSVGYTKMRNLLYGWNVEVRPQSQAKPERNATILQMVDSGKSDREIVEALKDIGVNRAIVIGVRSRNGRAPGAPSKTQGTLDKHRARRIWGRRQAAEAAQAEPDPLRQLEALVKPKAPPRPRLNGVRFARGEIEPTPATPDEIGVTRWVGLEKRTGCAWPDLTADEFIFCNAPRCSILPNGAPHPEPTAYCAFHWHKRRASAYSRIIAEKTASGMPQPPQGRKI